MSLQNWSNEIIKKIDDISIKFVIISRKHKSDSTEICSISNDHFLQNKLDEKTKKNFASWKIKCQISIVDVTSTVLFCKVTFVTDDWKVSRSKISVTWAVTTKIFSLWLLFCRRCFLFVFFSILYLFQFRFHFDSRQNTFEWKTAYCTELYFTTQDQFYFKIAIYTAVSLESYWLLHVQNKFPFSFNKIFLNWLENLDSIFKSSFLIKPLLFWILLISF